MKKLLVLFLSLFLVLGLVACGNNDEPEVVEEPAVTDEAEEVEDVEEPGDVEEVEVADDAGDIRIGLTMAERDQWLSYLEGAAVARADELGVELVAQDSQRDINLQLDHIQTFAAQGFDAIIINVVDPAFTEAMVEAAAGVPLIFVNRMPDEAFLEEGHIGYIGSDEMTAGRFQADFAAEYFADRDPAEIDYVLFLGIIGHPGTTARTASFREGMADHGFTINNVFEDTANFDRAEAMDMMQQFLGTGVNFDLVIANNDEMALGAIEALRAADMMDIPVLGIDASPHGVASIIAGEMAASVFQNPVGQGAGAVDKAIAAARGENFPTITWVPFELVTPENVHEYE
jgi:ABC-type sugar transport system substrate-binding protein